MTHPFEIELETALPASPEQVGEAIATGPGIDSWFMGRNELDPREGGTATMEAGGHRERPSSPPTSPAASTTRCAAAGPSACTPSASTSPTSPGAPPPPSSPPPRPPDAPTSDRPRPRRAEGNGLQKQVFDVVHRP